MRKAGDVVSALFKDRFGSDFMESARSTAGLFSSWEKIVTEIWPVSAGQKDDDVPAAAVHSYIRELERGVLLIEADHPGWIQILRTKQAELLSAARRRYPKLDIRGIAFRLGSPPKPEAAAGECEAQPVKKEQVERVSPLDKNPERDENFYMALKELDDSIKKRNGL